MASRHRRLRYSSHYTAAMDLSSGELVCVRDDRRRLVLKLNVLVRFASNGVDPTMPPSMYNLESTCAVV
jgi:hypothetical protein